MLQKSFWRHPCIEMTILEDLSSRRFFENLIFSSKEEPNPLFFGSGKKLEEEGKEGRANRRWSALFRYATPARTLYAKVGAKMALPVQIEFQESHIKRFISPAHNLLRPYDPVSTVTLRGPFVRRWRSNALGPRRYLRARWTTKLRLFIQRNSP